MNKKISFVTMHSNNLMSKLVILLLFFFCSNEKLSGQQTHFLYLQSDNFQPFYMKYNNQVFSSSATGYLILGKLSVPTLQIEIGLPQSNQPEWSFQLQLESNDKGFLFKNFGEKGWGLYELQKSTIHYALQNVDRLNGPSGETTAPSNGNAAFGNMLAWVTKDSTVTRVNTNIPVAEGSGKSQTETQKIPVIVDSSVLVQKQNVVDTIQVTKDKHSVVAKSDIHLISRTESRDGIDYRFEIQDNLQKDTIRVYIEKTVTANDTVQVSNSNLSTQVVDTILQSQPVQEPPITIKDEPVTIIENSSDEVKPATIPVATSVPNTNCKSYATDDVFLKLRKKMAGCNSEESMIHEAKKVFRSKCFTTAQIRNLGVLFLTDEWRYRFYDASMLFIADFSNFKTLEDTISDGQYKKRFEALLPNK
jgi:hypothetical protein